MKLSLSHVEYGRNGKRVEVEDGFVFLPASVEKALRLTAREYRTSSAGMIQIALTYYFGDGANHLGCADCGYWCQERTCCENPQAKGNCGMTHKEKTTLPLLDKGSVVVGQPLNDLRKRKMGNEPVSGMFSEVEERSVSDWEEHYQQQFELMFDGGGNDGAW